MKVKVLVPTAQEAAYLADALGPEVELVVSGVGMVRTAACVARIAARGEDRVGLVLAGVAGAYPGSGLAIGDCVAVGGERVADQGAWRDGAFVGLYGADYGCGLAGRLTGLPVVRSNSVNVGGAPFVVPDGAALIENMEGAAFFAVCLELGIPFVEVRAVSNFTGAPRSEWQIDRAARALVSPVAAAADAAAWRRALGE